MPTYVTTRNMTYNTRRLKAGDPFHASRRDGDLLIRLGRAELQPDALTTAAMQQPPKPIDPLATARADYEAAVGKRAFHGWDEAELRKRIADYKSGGINIPPPPAPAAATRSDHNVDADRDGTALLDESN